MTGCDRDKSFVFKKILEITRNMHFPIHVCCVFSDPAFFRFGTILACDVQMDGRKHNDSIYCSSMVLRGKNLW